jgi:hypothetical protein
MLAQLNSKELSNLLGTQQMIITCTQLTHSNQHHLVPVEIFTSQLPDCHSHGLLRQLANLFCIQLQDGKDKHSLSKTTSSFLTTQLV